MKTSLSLLIMLVLILRPLNVKQPAVNSFLDPNLHGDETKSKINNYDDRRNSARFTHRKQFSGVANSCEKVTPEGHFCFSCTMNNCI